MHTLKKLVIILLCLCSHHLWAQTNLDFIENKGQWDSRVLFKGELGNGAFFLRKDGFTILQHNPTDLRNLTLTMHGHDHDDKQDLSFFPYKVTPPDKRKKTKPVSPQPPDTSKIVRSHAYTMRFDGFNYKTSSVVPEKPLMNYNNYFIGNDPSKWQGNCKIYQAVTYKEIYPGIDARYYNVDGFLKYEFIVQPGADPSKIVMNFEGVDKLSLRNNELHIKTSVGEVIELPPYTYQYTASQRVKIDCRYVINGNKVSFKIKNYDPSTTLIIDPTLIFASLSGSLADNWGFTATYGANGTFFSGGIVFGGGFPVTNGAFQQNFGGGSGDDAFDMGIMKFTANGRNVIYATYIGGPGSDQPHSLYADAADNLVIAGRTNSGSSFPTTATYGPLGGWDITVTKLSANGSSLIGSVRIGGSGDDGVNISSNRAFGAKRLLNFYGDDSRSEVILDAAGNIVLASSTQSTDFYKTGNAQQPTFGGSQDAVLIKLDPTANNVLYSSYFGGNGDDAGFVLALNRGTGDIYMAGSTASTNLPTTPGVMQENYASTAAGRSDGYIAVFSNDGSILRRATYVGTAGTDAIYGIQFDRFNVPYIMGVSTGDWKKLNAVYGQDGASQFVGKINADLSGWVFRTHFGTATNGIPNMSPVAFLVDRCSNMYISGWGKNFEHIYPMAGVLGMPTTPDAIKSRTDNEDFYFIVIKKDAESLLYGSYFGQTGPLAEHVDGGTSRFDANGIIYQAICANCYAGSGTRPQWPSTPGAWCCGNQMSPSTDRSGCNLGAVKIAFNFAGVSGGPVSYINGVRDTADCIPMTVTFADTVQVAKRYIWDFGDGSPQLITTDFQVQHTYQNVGRYRVMLVAIDSNSCNISDTSYTYVRAGNDRAFTGISIAKGPDCMSLEYIFTNNSIAPPGKPFNDTSFVWDFGDGTVTARTDISPRNHTYASPGTYIVKMHLVDTAYCNSPQTITDTLRVSPLVEARFVTPLTGCTPYNAVFENTSLGGRTFEWDFGDGQTSTEANPTHLYNTAGTYNVRLVAYDPNTCNKVDDTTVTIQVFDAPTAAFTVTPDPARENTPNEFTNNSSADAVKFLWKFGDGDTLLTTSRDPVIHQYNASGTFEACLIAYNAAGCTDTACTFVTAIIVPKVDVPNAFTPLGPAATNTVYVRGFGIGSMTFTIYNRWGQKVFETNDIKRGWDGRWKGVVQPMDVYVYTLDITFTDKSKTTKKGDITLIR